MFNFCPRKGLFSAIGVRRTPSQVAALALAAKTAEAMRIEATGQWGPCANVRRSSSQGTALMLAAKTAGAMRKETTGQWGPCTDVRRSPSQGAALAVAAKARDIGEAHRVFAHLSEKVTQKTAQAMGIVTTDKWGFCETRF